VTTLEVPYLRARRRGAVKAIEGGSNGDHQYTSVRTYEFATP
jgi:hypothetical protein